MSDILRFQMNIPEEVALRYPEGKPVVSPKTGQPGMMFSLIDGRIMFLEPHVAERIRELGIQPEERFTICHAERREGQVRKRAWEIQRVDPPAPAPRPDTKPQGGGQGSSQANGSTPLNGKSNGNGRNGGGGNGNQNHGERVNGHAAVDGIPYFDAKTELLRCYEIGIEVLVAARELGVAKGLPVQFTGEDLRQVAATLYINAGKDARSRTWAR